MSKAEKVLITLAILGTIGNFIGGEINAGIWGLAATIWIYEGIKSERKYQDLKKYRESEKL